MALHRLSSTDAFIAFDFDDDVPATGITRLARKVLTDGAELLARSTTYAFATFEVQRGGGSAGINAEGEAVPEAVGAFVAEVRDMVEQGRWTTDPGLGLNEADFAPLREVDPRPAALWEEDLAAELDALGVAAAAGEFRSLDGAKVVLDSPTDQLREAVTAAGAEIVGEAGRDDRAQVLTTECDIVFAGGKAGSLDHETAALMHAAVVVPSSPVPVTARALAVLGRAGTVVVPDFVSTAASLLAGHDLDGGEPVERVRAAAAALSGQGTDTWMTAVQQAEAFLSSWRDELPFGRPLA